jgi:hypothetical protein
MHRQPVQSENIKNVGYDAARKVLEIEFHSGGIYQYSNVSSAVYDGLMRASSHGKFFHAHIKSLYVHHKL